MSYDNVLDGHILSIVQTQEIPEQVDLQNRLKERNATYPAGNSIAPVEKIEVAKVAGLYTLVDFNMPSLPLVLNIQISDYGLIVLHTHPGNASSLGSFIDKKYVAFSPQNSNNSGIIGTIAGDDTVLLIIKSKTHLDSVLDLIQEEFPYLKIPQ